MTTKASYRILVIQDEACAPQLSGLNGHQVEYAQGGAEVFAREVIPYDAILAMPHPQLRAFFERIRQKAGRRPALFVLQAEGMSLHTAESIGADGTLPTSAALSLLDPYLQLRDELLIAQGTIAQLREEAISAQRLKHELALLKHAIVRNVSHELGTPLLQVKSAVGMLNQDSVTNAKLIEYAKEATGRLESVIKNITLLGQSLNISPGPVVVRDVLEAARRNLRRAWEKGDKIDLIRSEIAPDLSPAIADKQGLVTVLQLLIDNALKFGKGKPVTVRAVREGDEIVISVHDQGIGIAQDKIDAIFDSFYQIDDSSTRHYGGAGVGLAIVKLILDYHKSEIRVSSELGVGSTFAFRLPVARI